MFRGEKTRRFGLDVDDADDLVFQDQRNSKFGQNIRVGRDVVLVGTHVFDKDRLSLQRSLTDDTLTHLDAHALGLGSMS